MRIKTKKSYKEKRKSLHKYPQKNADVRLY